MQPVASLTAADTDTDTDQTHTHSPPPRLPRSGTFQTDSPAYSAFGQISMLLLAQCYFSISRPLAFRLSRFPLACSHPPRFPDVPVTCVANSSFLSQWNSGFWRAVRLRKELTWEDLGRVLVNASSSRLARVPSPPSSSLLHHVFAGLHSFLHPKDVTFSHSLSLSHQPLALAGFHSFDTTSLSFHFCPSPVRFPVHLRSLRPKATRQATSSINQQQPRITAETWLQLCLERFLLLPGDG